MTVSEALHNCAVNYVRKARCLNILAVSFLKVEDFYFTAASSDGFAKHYMQQSNTLTHIHIHTPYPYVCLLRPLGDKQRKINMQL